MVIFSRSLEKNNRYSVIISAGDRSAYNVLCNMVMLKLKKRQVHKARSKEIRNSKKSSHNIKGNKIGEVGRMNMGSKGKRTDFVITDYPKRPSSLYLLIFFLVSGMSFLVIADGLSGLPVVILCEHDKSVAKIDCMFGIYFR